MWRGDCEPHKHWYSTRFTVTAKKNNSAPSTEEIFLYHCLLEVTFVIDVVHFVRARLVEVSVVIQACDSQAALLLPTGSFYQLQSRNYSWETCLCTTYRHYTNPVVTSFYLSILCAPSAREEERRVMAKLNTSVFSRDLQAIHNENRLTVLLQPNGTSHSVSWNPLTDPRR